MENSRTFDKFELAKHGTPVPGRDDIIKIDEHRYVITSNPYNVIINTSRAVKTKEENKPILDFLGKVMFDALLKQEVRRRGLDPDEVVWVD